MANNSKQCFNTHYQSHCHPTTKSLWLCSSVYCRPQHQSRRIWLVAAATNQKWLCHNCIALYVQIYLALHEFIYPYSENCNNSLIVSVTVKQVMSKSSINYYKLSVNGMHGLLRFTVVKIVLHWKHSQHDDSSILFNYQGIFPFQKFKNSH